jgi:tRNA A-37 threonylcarbamoyl transferase component Bud32/tetratricopeptide (TPR) repeat protein
MHFDRKGSDRGTVPIAGDCCITPDELLAFARGDLEPAVVGTLEAHLARCSDCRQLLSAIARTQSQPIFAAKLSENSFSSGRDDVPETSDRLAVGSRVNRYLVLNLLGEGAMGVVYKAHDSELNRSVALKVLRHDDAGAATRRLLREAQAMARLAHPNVVTVFDTGSIGGRVFIAMELVEGPTLTQWLSARPRTPRELISVFVAAGRGLAAAHSAGLVHRDFKPDNVLVGNDGRVCVSDFGLARAELPEVARVEQSSAADFEMALTISRSAVVGTPAYMSPEQHLGERTDGRADQFGFAVALYEALYGEPPFAGKTAQQLARLVTSGRVSPPPRGSKVPLRLRQVLLRALAPSPEERYSSMSELLEAIAPEMTPRHRRLRAIATSVLALLAMVCATAYVVQQRRVALARAELWGELRGVVPEMRALLRTDHMLPEHDIRPECEKVRKLMTRVTARLQTGRWEDAVGLGDYVLGEGYLALGENRRALELLETAWRAGARGAEIDTALGRALGIAYESALREVEKEPRSPALAAKMRSIQERYRDPALAHLRAAVGATDVPPAYLEGLILFHQHRFAEAAERAHSAFVASPTFYEAGMVEAKARSAMAVAALRAGRDAEAIQLLADAHKTSDRVIEIARSDDQARLVRAELAFDQAHEQIQGGELPADLRKEVLSALQTALRINPDNGNAYLLEAKVLDVETNIKVNSDSDPRADVDRLRSLARKAGARGGDKAEIDSLSCDAHWALAVYQTRHAINPRPAFDEALAVCKEAVTLSPSAARYDSLGVVYAWLMIFEGQNGGDPTSYFALAERNYRTSLNMDDDPGTHYNLGRLWTFRASYEADHGQNPGAAVKQAIAEFEATLRLNRRRADAFANIDNVLVASARYQLEQGEDPGPTLLEAQAADESALAIDPNLIAALKYRIYIPLMEAQYLFKHDASPLEKLERTRVAAHKVLELLPKDCFTHRLLSTGHLVQARWAMRQHGEPEVALARAAAEASLALQDNAADAPSLATNAEVEELRAELSRWRGRSPAAAVKRGLAFVERAMRIDPRLEETLRVRDALLRR